MEGNTTFRKILENKEIRLLHSVYGNLPEDNIAEKIYKLRKMHGLNLREFADRVSRHPTSIIGWEEGKKIPMEASIEKICSVFELDIADMKGSGARGNCV